MISINMSIGMVAIFVRRGYNTSKHLTAYIPEATRLEALYGVSIRYPADWGV